MPPILSCNPSGKWGFKLVITPTLTKPTTDLQSSAVTDGDQNGKSIRDFFFHLFVVAYSIYSDSYTFIVANEL